MSWNDIRVGQDDLGDVVDLDALIDLNDFSGESQFGLDPVSLGMLAVLGIGGLMIHHHFSRKHRHQHMYQQHAAYASSGVGSAADDQSAEMAGLMGPTASNPYGLAG